MSPEPMPDLMEEGGTGTGEGTATTGEAKKGECSHYMNCHMVWEGPQKIGLCPLLKEVYIT